MHSTWSVAVILLIVAQLSHCDQNPPPHTFKKEQDLLSAIKSVDYALVLSGKWEKSVGLPKNFQIITNYEYSWDPPPPYKLYKHSESDSNSQSRRWLTWVTIFFAVGSGNAECQKVVTQRTESLQKMLSHSTESGIPAGKHVPAVVATLDSSLVR